MTPIFVISLKHSVARRAGLLQKLADLGMKATVFDAVDGLAGLAEPYLEMIDREGSREKIFRVPSDAEFACALSHYSLYTQIAEGDARYAAILEDDAIILDGFQAVVGALGHVDFDLLLLDHQKTYVSQTNLKLTKEFMARKVMLSPELTTGYVISRAFARYMVDNSLPICGTADWLIDIEDHYTYAVFPRVVDHPEDETTSEIQASRGKTQSERSCRRLFRRSYWTAKIRKFRYERIS